MFDRTFDQHLRTLWPTAADEQTLHWQHAREMFERERNQLSSYRGGLTPAEARPITFLTSMFLHGGWDHLLGNMIFLFLFGFTLDRKSTRLNSSHVAISYAVFCLKKKKITIEFQETGLGLALLYLRIVICVPYWDNK